MTAVRFFEAIRKRGYTGGIAILPREVAARRGAIVHDAELYVLARDGGARIEAVAALVAALGRAATRNAVDVRDALGVTRASEGLGTAVHRLALAARVLAHRAPGVAAGS